MVEELGGNGVVIELRKEKNISKSDYVESRKM